MKTATANSALPSPPQSALPWQRLWRGITETQVAFASIGLAVILGIATSAVIAGPGFLEGQSDIAAVLLILDALILLVLCGLVLRQIMRLIHRRQRRRAGYQLHWRLVILFSLITVLPALLVMAFSVFVLDYSLRGWFNNRISTAVEESVTIANAYLAEHKQSVSGQILAMANDINREAGNLIGEQRRFNAYLTNQARVRSLSEALVVDSTGRVLARSDFAYAISFSNLDQVFFDAIRQGDVAIDSAETSNRIRAGVRLNQFADAYLLVGRFVDPTVLLAVDKTQVAASAYQLLDIRQFDLQISFAVLFGLVSLLLLLGSVWVGLNFANAIVSPISTIISTADQVRGGNLAIRVGALKDKGEIGELAASFDKMLDEIDRGRHQLLTANAQLDKRREFTEAVLGGVSSGVIGIDEEMRITLPNRAAQSMLGLKPRQVSGKPLAKVLPEFVPLIELTSMFAKRSVEHNIEIHRKPLHLNLLARVTRETIDGRVAGYVITFDDVSDLLTAQRKAAWADVARRIAHEIRNPLTPIQLAAEHLAGKLPTGGDEKSNKRFAINIDTIIRQVGDIRRLVDEFSAFARMPSPDLAEHDLLNIIETQMSLFSAAAKGIAITTDFGGHDKIMLHCDDGMVRQVITNLLQNAVDAMREANSKNKKIKIVVSISGQDAIVKIIDSGPGFPVAQRSGKKRQQLLDPYITHREKGSGLGLAIVNKIMQDHSGTISLHDASDYANNDASSDAKEANPYLAEYGGAMVVVVFRLKPETVLAGKHKQTPAKSKVQHKIGEIA
ncbi:MAG: ATP-binding protein [Proteobacteria bacterium]|nr:ATP-binding protein [Pseudomonadota bacterium]